MTSLYISSNTIQQNSLGNPFDNANKRAHGGGIHGYISYSVISGNSLIYNELLNTIDGAGGAMYFKLSMPTIEANLIAQNHAEFGSAIYCILSSPKIARNAIYNNMMYDTSPLPLYLGSEEGAITLDMGEGFLIEGNLIFGNEAGVGAGINAKTNLSGRIENNVIAYNMAYDPTSFGGMGGGIYALAPLIATESLFIVNNTIIGNVGTVYLGEEGGGIAVSIPPQIAGPEPIPDRIVIANNIIGFNSSGIFETLTTPMVPPTLIKNDFHNTGANYINVPPGTTDITQDPVFVDRDGGDFRLAPDSPCIDAGSNSYAPVSTSTDNWGNPRIFDGNRNGDPLIDMGAYELYFPLPGTVDYDGDRKSDMAVWRPDSGIWYALSSTSPGTFTSTQWGSMNDRTVPGDYDGDGKTDVAVWRPENGAWFVLPSNSPGTYSAIQWGANSDIPTTGNYDGDAKTDIAVWRPDSGIWYLLPSGTPGTFTATQWGINSDIAVPFDYDGDGRTDIAVWRPESGTWYVLPSNSPGTYLCTQWGMNSDVPVPGDYDGDRKADIAVWRPDSGIWYLLPSGTSGTYTATQWGADSDIPTPGDYDGDGKTDIAVWRPDTGIWFLLPSGAPGIYTATQWGASGDEAISCLSSILQAFH